MAIGTPQGYRALDDRTLASYLAGLPALRARLGGEPADWQVTEVGDGNLNLVFMVAGPAGDLCVKQALPYVRLVGDSWPLDLKRAWFEHRAASIQSQHAPQLHPPAAALRRAALPDRDGALSPHVIMRRGMIQGVIYPAFAAHIAEYLAATLYFTSDLALPAAEKRALVADFSGNTDLCKITEDLIFTDPYMVCEPQPLDQPAARRRGGRDP